MDSCFVINLFDGAVSEELGYDVDSIDDDRVKI